MASEESFGPAPATRTRAYARAKRLGKLCRESDLEKIRFGLVLEVAETITMALEKKRTFYKDGEAFEYDEPDFNAAMRGYELLGRWLLLDPDELIERSAKIKAAFERSGRKAA